MRVALSWLKDFVEITIPLDDLIHRMIMAGLEVANVDHIGDAWQRDKLFVGEILEIKPHPNAERLVLAVVEYGRGTPQRGGPSRKCLLRLKGQSCSMVTALPPRSSSSSGPRFVAWNQRVWSVPKRN